MHRHSLIVIADDHPLFRGALRQALAPALPMTRLAEANGLESLNEILAREPDADLVLLDLAMPGVQGFSALVALRAQHPAVPVVVVSGTEDHKVIRRALALGAAGFIPKSVPTATLSEAILAVLDGGTWAPEDVDLAFVDDAQDAVVARRISTLTPQQVRVLGMLTEGLLNKQIAYEIGVTEATVKAHVSAILEKLQVESRTQAVIAASKLGIGEGPRPALAS